MNSKTILKVLKKYKTFLISTHANADFDALTCELVLALYLKSLKKKFYIVNNENPRAMHDILPRIKLVKKYKGQKISYDAAVILDCGNLERVEKVQSLIDKDKPIINLDHHITNDFFGSHNLVKPEASSTAEIIFEILKEDKFKLTKDCAVLLYLGIMTDTGSFRYDNTTAYTHHIVSELLKFKFPVNPLYQRIYEMVPLNDFKKFVQLMNHFEITRENQVAFIALSKKVYHGFSDEFDLREKIFNFLRFIKGIQVIIIATEIDQKNTRMNFRSQGKADVAKLASFFDGGGHKKASGCKISAPLKEAKKKLFSKLNQVL